MLAAAALAPLALAVPVVWMSERHSAELRATDGDFRAEIARVDRAIVEIKDLNRVNAMYLSRKPVLEEINVNRPDVARLFALLASSPKELRIEGVVAANGVMTLIGSSTDPLVPPATVAALESAGFQQVALTHENAKQGAGAGERFTIRASPGARARPAAPEAAPKPDAVAPR